MELELGFEEQVEFFREGRVFQMKMKEITQILLFVKRAF